MDATVLLTNDHEQVRRLFSDLENAEGNEERLKLFAEIERQVRIHSQIEEELFYPAFRDATEDLEDKEQFYEAIEEHRAVDMLFPGIKQEDPASPGFKAKVKVLQEMIEHHASEEESEMFSKAREHIGDEALENLGLEMEHRKMELEKAYPALDTGFMQARTAGAAARHARR